MLIRPVRLHQEEVRPDPVVLIKGKVLNANTNEPLYASVHYKTQKIKSTAGIARSDPQNGNYKIILPEGDAYQYLARIDGYLSISKRIDLTESNGYGEVEEDLFLVPLEKGQKIPLSNIFFIRSQAEMQAKSFVELNRLVEILNEHPTLEIELGGHTDNLGQTTLNFDLSLRRVDAVKQYLTTMGITPDRLHTKGYGDTMPIASNDKELNRRLNRRVEFTILSL